MKQKTPLISIIIPVYNCEKYIADCLESAAKQTYNNIEVIVVDDGSTDRSGAIAKEYAKSNPQFAYYKRTNHGVSASRNYGIEKSKGDYLFFIDSDDCIAPDCIEYYYSLIKSFEAEIAILPMPNKFLTGKLTTPEDATMPSKSITGQDAMRMMLHYEIVISSWGKMFSKKLIKEHNIRFNEQLAYGEGFSFTIECLQQAKRVAIGYKKVYNYRLDNANSAMTRYSRRLVTDSLKAQDYIRSKVNCKDDATKAALDYALWHTKCDCLNTIIGSKTTKDGDLKETLIRDIRKSSLRNLKEPIPKVDKIKSVLFAISPSITSRSLNLVRKRKFTKE